MTDDHPGYTPLDPVTSLRYARAAEDRYQGTDLPPPDLNAGACSECHRSAHARFHHGQAELCRTCRRRRDQAIALPEPSASTGSSPPPRWHGPCQRCPSIQAIPLELVAAHFLCPLHATRARQAQRAAKARSDRMRGASE